MDLCSTSLQGASRGSSLLWHRRLIAGSAGLLSALLATCELARSRALTGLHPRDPYNDGVYFGSALRLVGGHLPYRDFVFLHPPGIAIVLAPIAALSHVVGEPAGLAVARLLTAGAQVGVVVVGTLTLRYRGRVAMVATGVALACFPLAVDVANTVQLEPYYVFFCLLGTLALFGPSGSFTTQRNRLFMAGLAFGFACVIKAWALMPVAALGCVRG